MSEVVKIACAMLLILMIVIICWGADSVKRSLPDQYVRDHGGRVEAYFTTTWTKYPDGYKVVTPDGKVLYEDDIKRAYAKDAHK